MKLGRKPVVVLLAVLGAGDLATVPVMAAAHSQNPSQPPVAAIVATAFIGLVTLACSGGLARLRRWPVPVATALRVLDSVSALLGLVAHPNATLVGVAAANLILSVLAIVLLQRLSGWPDRHGQSRKPSPEPAAAPPGDGR
jgi:hypothetical protein